MSPTAFSSRWESALIYACVRVCVCVCVSTFLHSPFLLNSDGFISWKADLPSP